MRNIAFKIGDADVNTVTKLEVIINTCNIA